MGRLNVSVLGGNGGLEVLCVGVSRVGGVFWALGCGATFQGCEFLECFGMSDGFPDFREV